MRAVGETGKGAALSPRSEGTVRGRLSVLRAMIETFAAPLPADIHAAAESVMRRACDQRLSIALAESCTGGLFSAVLTDIEGCAHGFERGFVTYTDPGKHEALGVPMSILETAGAVSAPAARAMADGAIARSEADLALSITGFAGPGGPGDEAGLVYFGLARRGGSTRILERHFGDKSRAEVRLACLREGLALLEEAI